MFTAKYLKNLINSIPEDTPTVLQKDGEEIS